MNPYEAIEYAAELLVGAGFALRYTSMKSEARYYALPGIHDTIRVAVHRADKQMIGVPGRVMAKITFMVEGSPKWGLSHDRVEHETARAIGWYFMRCAGLMKYKGKLRINVNV